MADSLAAMRAEHHALRVELLALRRERDQLAGTAVVSAEYQAYLRRLEAFHLRLDKHLAGLEKASAAQQPAPASFPSVPPERDVQL